MRIGTLRPAPASGDGRHSIPNSCRDSVDRLATRVDLPLILLAGLTMATARYL